MSEKWNTGGYNGTIRLGQLAVKAQGLLVTHKLRNVRAMIDAQRKHIRKIPGGEEKLAAAKQQLDEIDLKLKEGLGV
jgi:hypothetical protein